MNKKSIKFRLFLFMAGYIAPLYIRFLKFSTKFEIINEEYIIQLKEENKPFLLTFWHGNMLIPMMMQIGNHFYTLVSQHGDGEIITKALKGLGYDSIRGSSTRGGKEALKEMIRLGKEGARIAITPDGPKGPFRELKMGAVVFSQRSGIPILPVSGQAIRAKNLKSWDKFLLVKPFSRAVNIYGKPVYVDKALKGEELEKKRAQIESIIHDLDKQADAWRDKKESEK